MSMDKFHCHTFELSFQFKAEDFDKEGFSNAIAEAEFVERYSDDEAEDYGISLGSRSESQTPHAHLRVRLRKEKPSRIELSYHNSRMAELDEKLPVIEECAHWLSQFLKIDSVEAHTHVGYTFDKAFASIVPLMYPLATTEKALIGSYVMGMSILLPKGSAAESAIIQGTEEDFYLFLSGSFNADLKTFDLLSELERLSTSVDSLVRKREGGDENDSTSA